MDRKQTHFAEELIRAFEVPREDASRSAPAERPLPDIQEVLHAAHQEVLGLQLGGRPF